MRCRSVAAMPQSGSEQRTHNNRRNADDEILDAQGLQQRGSNFVLLLFTLFYRLLALNSTGERAAPAVEDVDDRANQKLLRNHVALFHNHHRLHHNQQQASCQMDKLTRYREMNKNSEQASERAGRRDRQTNIQTDKHTDRQTRHTHTHTN